MVLQSPLRALVDPDHDLPLPATGDECRRHTHRYPCDAPARLRLNSEVYDVRFQDIGYGGARLVAASQVPAEIGDQAIVIARTEHGLFTDNIEVVNMRQTDDGTIVHCKLTEPEDW